MKQKYFKATYQDGKTTLFSSNNQNANLLVEKFVTGKGGNMQEITKADYKKEELIIEI